MWRAVLAAAAAAMAAARELDPAACAARFDVQRDKIIRTEESREMGARYLSELDVGARHECRRLCCETDSCDVFVYEEKSPGSCYLFNCGPPEDFRCKFTAHSNFSSGVLALSRRLAELQDQERLAPPPPPPPPTKPPPSTTLSTTASTPPTSPAPVVHPPRPPQSEVPQQVSTGRCSRYQWECHTGGECIAVYNACDGVPQCADGSDEAPELGCPAVPAPPAPPPPVHAPPPPPPTRPPPVVPPLYPSQLQVFEQEGEVSEAGGAGGERWPHRLLQAQPRRFPAPENTVPHIFSHKGGLVQEEAFEPPPMAPAPQPWPRRPWTQHQGVESNPWGGWAREWGDATEPRAAAAPWPAQPPRDREPAPYLSPGTMPEMPVLYPQRRPPHDQPKKGLGLSEAGGAAAGPPTAASSTAPPAPAPRPPPPPPPPPAVATPRHDALQEHDHDGLSERPPAAVLLLVLGLCMTGALGAAIMCRARAARRRRGKPLAHDADYLVNGMYL